MKKDHHRECKLTTDIFFHLVVIIMVSNASFAYIISPLSAICTKDEDFRSDNISYVLDKSALHLEGSGQRSAARLSIRKTDAPCFLTVEVPKETHAIAISLHKFPEGIACPVYLWFHEGEGNDGVWSLDLCGKEKRKLLALYPKVYPHRVTLRWIPVFSSKDFGNSSTRINKVLPPNEPMEIIVTAVGRGSICEEENKVLCWKVMKESLCVSEELACDGYHNCPRPGNDESESMCPPTPLDIDMKKDTPTKAWAILTDHFRRMKAIGSGDSAVNLNPWRNRGLVMNDNRRASAGGAISNSQEDERNGDMKGESGGSNGLSFGVISRLGPWTFVLLCMLACGSLLLLCGLWECCCHSPKDVSIHSLSPRGSLAVSAGNGQHTTTVVIISSASTPPPQYEELEQPPDYLELFPGRIKTTAV